MYQPATDRTLLVLVLYIDLITLSRDYRPDTGVFVRKTYPTM